MSICINDSFDYFSTSNFCSSFISLNPNVFINFKNNFNFGFSNVLYFTSLFNSTYDNSIIFTNNINFKINYNPIPFNLYSTNTINATIINCYSNISISKCIITNPIHLKFTLNNNINNNINNITFIINSPLYFYNILYIPYNGIYSFNFLAVSDTISTFWININNVKYCLTNSTNCCIQLIIKCNQYSSCSFGCTGNIKKEYNGFITKASIILLQFLQ